MERRIKAQIAANDLVQLQFIPLIHILAVSPALNLARP